MLSLGVGALALRLGNCQTDLPEWGEASGEVKWNLVAALFVRIVCLYD